MQAKRKFNRFILALLPAGLFIYASIRPQVHLRTAMPPDFVDVPAQADSAHLAAERQVAEAYWDRVVSAIQWQYAYGAALPEAAPQEFSLGTQSASDSETNEASRIRYWNRLRKAWLDPNLWVTSRAWSTDWFTEPLVHGVQTVQRFLKDKFATV